MDPASTSSLPSVCPELAVFLHLLKVTKCDLLKFGPFSFAQIFDALVFFIEAF